MAKSVITSISVGCTATLTNPNSLSTPTDRVTIPYNVTLQNGTGHNENDQKFSDLRALDHGETDSLTLSDSSLADGLGGFFAISRLKTLMIVNLSDHPASELSVEFWNGDEYSAVTFMGVIQKGGCFLIAAPEQGYRVVPSIHNHLSVTNLSGSEPALYSVVVTGTSE